MERPSTLAELKQSGYQIKSVKDEMRDNLIRKLRAKEPLFPGIIGYEETVLPQIQNAILSRHDMLFLGLRGQAKTRMLRQLIYLLDDAIPIVAGSEINDDPFHPISRQAREIIAGKGDQTPIEWIGRDRRFHEKLATPDVTIADLIGEIDMIKHAEGRYLSSELTMHFGLIPRTNRGIFCMNELPDLSPKIQVGLFNVLEERDIQIRGYPIRLELDVCLVFSANPEDYTNRGRIVTPLKDRIGSVIRTHYPLTRDDGIRITEANAWTERNAKPLYIPHFMKEVLEEVARVARNNPSINQQSGVSVRMSIANFENMVSNAERRSLVNDEETIVPRISDLAYLAASSRGKLELTMSEDDGSEDRVIGKLLGEAVKNIFDQYFHIKQFRGLVEWFESGQNLVASDQLSGQDFAKTLQRIPALSKEVEKFMEKMPDMPAEARDAVFASVAELILEGLHVSNRLNKNHRDGQSVFER